MKEPITYPTTYPLRFFNKLVILFNMLLVAVCVHSCSSVSYYDQYAYTLGTSLKVDALALMDKATDNFQNHAVEVEELKIKIDKAYEYEIGRPNNDITIKMWQILRDPEKKLLGGFLKRWEAENTLSRAFIDEVKINIGKGFDLINHLESEKITPEEANSNFLQLFGN